MHAKAQQNQINVDANSLIGPIATFVSRSYHLYPVESFEQAAATFKQYQQDEPAASEFYGAAAKYMEHRAAKTKAELEESVKRWREVHKETK